MIKVYVTRTITQVAIVEIAEDDKALEKIDAIDLAISKAIMTPDLEWEDGATGGYQAEELEEEETEE